MVAAVGADGCDRKIPAFQLAAMTFAIGALVRSRASCSGQVLSARCRQPLVAWAVGVGGLFGYHALYFVALRLRRRPRPDC